MTIVNYQSTRRTQGLYKLYGLYKLSTDLIERLIYNYRLAFHLETDMGSFFNDLQHIVDFPITGQASTEMTVTGNIITEKDFDIVPQRQFIHNLFDRFIFKNIDS